MIQPELSDRSTLRSAYRLDEEQCIAERIDQAALPAETANSIQSLAVELALRAREAQSAGGLDAFLHSYDLGSEEGVALMCLAEALLRIPDADTRDRLIADKIMGGNWERHLGESGSLFVNASTYALMLTGKVLKLGEGEEGWPSIIGHAVARLGEPVIRQAVAQAMRVLGHQFVFGATIEEALERGESDLARGTTHSFDMLGEAAKTFADARRYADAYAEAIAAVGKQGTGRSPEARSGISVKLSALHPRYEYLQAGHVEREMLPVLRNLAEEARRAGIGFTIDAEEADRLELSLDLIEALVADDSLFADGWTGFGIAVQAYQKRAVPLIDWIVALARKHRHRLMVRLVKGAYWDSEIKAAQVGGFADYPVFTRKASTDVSYIACAKRLLASRDVLYPAFATHNAYSVAAIKALAGEAGGFEFQRLHGMGETLYAGLAAVERERGEGRSPVRIYAPVGDHKDLLAYLVRRLLENGANSSFVNRLSDVHLPVEALVTNPVDEVKVLAVRRNPAIPLPKDIFQPTRRNSNGIDLSDPLIREPLLARLGALERKRHKAATTTGGKAQAGTGRRIYSPFDRALIVGDVVDATEKDIADSMRLAVKAQPAWDRAGVDHRAKCLENAATLYEAHSDEFLSLCIREAGKTLPDAVAELREAVDFLYYYAASARVYLAPVTMPGPTGEDNRLTLNGRGAFVAISPWNFPLAIFTGQVSAALVAGNAVLAKSAEQTPLIAALAVSLLHQAGVPGDVLQLLPGDGRVGAALVADENIGGVVFTGSTVVAREISRTLAAKDGPIVPLIAETGGQNAMIVDSSALPEQVTRDVLSSAFQSAGQRCSALRVLFIQEDVADPILRMISGAMEALTVGDPRLPETDVGPVIDAEAKTLLCEHLAELSHSAKPVSTPQEAPQDGYFVPPAAYEIGGIEVLTDEHFGPVLHVVRFRPDELDEVVDRINATGFGLTLGIHSRIEATVDRIIKRARVGNIYVNRNQIGAVVGSQPFGGEGLSGTGPKAGGPHYLQRFAVERLVCVDTTAAGGNASLIDGT